jgi:hypothetical protein
MAEIVCEECGYRVNVVRTSPTTGKPEHDRAEFERLCQRSPFRHPTGTGCSVLDRAYLAAVRSGAF